MMNEFIYQLNITEPGLGVVDTYVYTSKSAALTAKAVYVNAGLKVLVVEYNTYKLTKKLV